MRKKVLVCGEESQRVCIAFRDRGHDAFSCDILDCSGGKPEWHIKKDARKVAIMGSWDIIIAHPVCKYLANSGVKHLVRNGKGIDPVRWLKLEEAIKFFNFFSGLAEHVCRENPIPHCYARDGYYNHVGDPVYGIGKYTQIVHPWQFGHKEMKSTCLWLEGLPELIPTDIVGPPPKDKEERKKWAVVHRMPPGPDREKLRSKTYPGIALAMAEQWG